MKALLNFVGIAALSAVLTGCGTFAGAVAGAAIDGPRGALVGAAAGAVVDSTQANHVHAEPVVHYYSAPPAPQPTYYSQNSRRSTSGNKMVVQGNTGMTLYAAKAMLQNHRCSDGRAPQQKLIVRESRQRHGRMQEPPNVYAESKCR
jgi:hypothetical protein